MGQLKKPISIKSVIKGAIKYNYFQYGIRINYLQKRWDQIVGEKLYKFTYPNNIYKDTLYIKCSHQGWINTLQTYKKEILSKVNTLLNDKYKVSNIRFVYGNITQKNHIKQKRKKINKKFNIDKNNQSFENLIPLFNEFFRKCNTDN